MEGRKCCHGDGDAMSPMNSSGRRSKVVAMAAGFTHTSCSWLECVFSDSPSRGWGVS